MSQGQCRIELKHIGFWPGNRGGLGINSHHVHEVANDVMANRTSLSRYQCVDIVEIPADMREQIHKVNRRKCESDPFMPRFSADIKYVCATKTHFVHAQKLAQEGGHALYNQGAGGSLKWKPEDTEGALILEKGPICVIYSSDLLNDVDALTALMGEDNANADIQWGEDEMQAFGRATYVFKPSTE